MEYFTTRGLTDLFHTLAEWFVDCQMEMVFPPLWKCHHHYQDYATSQGKFPLDWCSKATLWEWGLLPPSLPAVKCARYHTNGKETIHATSWKSGVTVCDTDCCLKWDSQPTHTSFICCLRNFYSLRVFSYLSQARCWQSSISPFSPPYKREHMNEWGVFDRFHSKIAS